MPEHVYVNPDKTFFANRSGVRVEQHLHCAHGDSSLFLALYGAYDHQGDDTAALYVALPRCAFAEMIGSVYAQLRHAEGEAALADFQDAIQQSVQKFATQIERMYEQRRDCCEAGFRTNGAEHTCGRTDGTQK
ncbi:hypothetical protein [Streptomyces sp. NPDC005281]|uniref:hypothetical protein n=1 Tax=Streptomyces sp. NPDC005281 TaxID=3155712 RepID=UPI0033B143EA